MNRREFLEKASLPAAALVLGGGFVGNRLHARSELQKRLVKDCLPPFTTKSHRELTEHPVLAREEVRLWFHKKCLDTVSFVEEIFSEKFARQLIGRGDAQKLEMLQVTFCRTVMTEAETLTRVDAIASEIGTRVDQEWFDYCGQVAQKWNLQIRPHRENFRVTQLAQRTETLVRENLAEVLNHARAVGETPALSETILSVGQAAILMLRLGPLASSAPAIAVPLFLVSAFRAGSTVWQYVLGQLSRPAADCQAAISRSLATLGNRVAAELETEVRVRIADLHNWQEIAIRSAAETYSREVLPLPSI